MSNSYEECQKEMRQDLRKICNDYNIPYEAREKLFDLLKDSFGVWG